MHLICSDITTIIFIGSEITEQNLILFKIKAEDYLNNFLIPFENASENIITIYENNMDEESTQSLKSILSDIEDIKNLTNKYEKYNYWYENNQSLKKLNEEFNKIELNKPNKFTEKATQKIEKSFTSPFKLSFGIVTDPSDSFNLKQREKAEEDNQEKQAISLNLPKQFSLGIPSNTFEKIEEPTAMSNLEKMKMISNLETIRQPQEKNKSSNKNITEEIEEEKINKKTLIYPEKEKNSFLDIEDFDCNGFIVILTENDGEKKVYIWKSPDFEEDEEEIKTYLEEVQEIFYGTKELDDVEVIYEIPYEESEEFFKLF